MNPFKFQVYNFFFEFTQEFRKSKQLKKKKNQFFSSKIVILNTEIVSTCKKTKNSRMKITTQIINF